MEVNSVNGEETSVNVGTTCTEFGTHSLHCSCERDSLQRVSLFTFHAHKTTHYKSPHSSTKTPCFSSFHIIKHKSFLLPSSQHTWKHAVRCCCDMHRTTSSPSVMFYKHILNNSAHPHLPNGLLFPAIRLSPFSHFPPVCLCYCVFCRLYFS